MSAHGILSKKEDFTSEKGLTRVLNYQIDEAAQIELEVIIEQIRHLNEGIKKLEDEMTDRGTKLKGYEVTGVPRTARDVVRAPGLWVVV